MNDDMELVREYAARQSEQAFETLVSRNVGLVHSAALRQLRDLHLAEEITQTVFIILARKADSLNPKTILPGWLYRTTRYVSAAALKIQRRRERREQEAHMEAVMQENQTDPAWEQLSPLLDEAMADLRDKDRDAIVLRYFQNRSLRDVGAALGVDEYAAQKRVARALEKLRAFFVKRGIDSTAETVAGTISANSVQAAPVVLAKSVAAVAMAKGAAASTSTLTLIKGALKIMAWTKMKTTVIAGIILAATATTGVVEYELVQSHRAGPPLLDVECDIQTNGVILARATIEIINTSKKTLNHDSFNDDVKIERLTDGTGQAVKYTMQPGDNGNAFKIIYSLNQPVPPGGKYLLKIEGTVDGAGVGMIKPTGEPNVFEIQMNSDMGNEYAVHRIDVFRLPPGAVLLEKSPADLAATTNSERIALRMDKMLPPPGKTNFRIRYQLASAAK